MPVLLAARMRFVACPPGSKSVIRCHGFPSLRLRPAKRTREGILRPSSSKQEPAWKFGFQLNERYLQWGESGQGRFLKLYCGEKLGWSSERVDSELQALVALLPGLELRFDRMKADLLLRLLTHRNTVAANMIALRRELPDANIDHIVSRYPALVTNYTEQELVDRIKATREALPEVPEIGGMLEVEPRVLATDVPWLLSEIERLLPGHNPQQLLVQNPSSYMDMMSQGLRSSLLDEPGLQSLDNHSKG
eukprot:jgi/Ulvmu1/7162/UM034_0070.1